MSAHLPGPWAFSDEWSSDGRGAYAPIYCNYGAAGMKTVAEARGDSFSGELQANARLIAASPVLLEALQRICGGEGLGVALGDLEFARAAIAKAGA